MKLQIKDQTMLQQDSITAIQPHFVTLQQKGIGIVRIVFGVAWAAAAFLKWQPVFIQSFADTISGASQGQPALIQTWIGLWKSIVLLNPTGFGFLPALVESLLAICFIFGIFTNSAAFIGIFWSFTIWSVPEGFGGPYALGHSTDTGTAFPYLLLCTLLLLLSAGRYLGIDSVLTPKLGRLGFLASGPLRTPPAI